MCGDRVSRLLRDDASQYSLTLGSGACVEKCDPVRCSRREVVRIQRAGALDESKLFVPFSIESGDMSPREQVVDRIRSLSERKLGGLPSPIDIAGLELEVNEEELRVPSPMGVPHQLLSEGYSLLDVAEPRCCHCSEVFRLGTPPMNAGARLELFGCPAGIPRVQEQACRERRELRVPPIAPRFSREVCGRAAVPGPGEG